MLCHRYSRLIENLRNLFAQMSNDTCYDRIKLNTLCQQSVFLNVGNNLLIFVKNIAKRIISTMLVRHVPRFPIFVRPLFKHCTVTNQIFAIAYIPERLSSSFVNGKSWLSISVVIVKKKFRINRMTAIPSSNIHSPLVFYQTFLSECYF